MKTSKITKVALALAVVFLLVSSLSVLAAEPITVAGLLQDGDNGLELAVEGQIYQLEGDISYDLAGQTVEVTGTVETMDDGSMVITVESFQELEG